MEKSVFNDFDELKNVFSGGTLVRILKEGTSNIPDVPGVYFITKKNDEPASFLKIGTGGHFKDKDPNVEITELSSNWVNDTIVVYIGKATSLKRRLRQYMQFGKGKKIGHWGGRYIWQLSYADDLQVWWFPTDRPRDLEQRLIAEFKKEYGKRPFANLVD